MQQFSEAIESSGINATALLVQGPTVGTILDQAKRLNADLIILGSHGHGAVYRAVLGSTSEGVLHGSKVPVLIVPTRPKN